MARVKQLPNRQRYRKALLLLSFLFLPLTLYYFSPALILSGASQGVVNGSAIAFSLMFVGSLVLGRLWCGWACPVGALQELAAPIHDAPPPSGRFNWIKWGIWLPWIGLIVFLALQSGGYRRIDPLYQIEGGLTLAIPPSLGAPPWYLIYYIIIALFLILAVALGRRAGCRAVCWMAPFMILGRKASNAARAPALRLRAEAERCSDCELCTRNCPMGLDVHGMVRRGDMEHNECMLCGNCVDNCPKGTLRYAFARRSGRGSR